SMIVDNKPISLKIRTIDLKIIRCLLNNPRMSTTEIAKSTSISSKSVIRWLRKMEDNDMLNFTIIRDISSMQLVGYIEFAMIIKIDKQYLKNLTRMIIDDMKEYLLFMPHLHDTDMIFAVFFCANIPTVDLIFSNLETSIGVIHIKIFITTDLSFYQEWIFNAIEKKLIS
ncbi:MAG TPA: AsnC family protein, partial [Candidatus Nitrosocosmicus sp.]